MEWPTSKTISFVKEYAKHCCLWDTTNVHYKRRNARIAALNSIINELNMDNMTISIIKNKIHTVRSVYSKELKKVLASKKSGAGTADIYIPKVPWFGLADSFLRRSMLVRKSTSILNICEVGGIAQLPNYMDEETEMSNGSEITIDDMPINQSNEPSLNDIFVDAGFVLSESSTSYDSNTAATCSTAKRKCENDRDVQLRTDVETPRAISKRSCISPAPIEENECDLYCKHIATQLKKLPQRDIVELQGEIQALMTKKKLAAMEHNSSQMWIANSKRLDLFEKTTKYAQENCRICSLHFEDRMFANPERKNRLRRCALPTIFNVPDLPNNDGHTNRKMRTKWSNVQEYFCTKDKKGNPIVYHSGLSTKTPEQCEQDPLSSLSQIDSVGNSSSTQNNNGTFIDSNDKSGYACSNFEENQQPKHDSLHMEPIYVEQIEYDDPRRQSSSTKDEDEAFMLSILPSVQRFDENGKVEFRTEVLNAIKKINNYKYSTKSSSSQSCVTPTITSDPSPHSTDILEGEELVDMVIKEEFIGDEFYQ